MKYKNLSEADLRTLREKHASACEKWAKTPQLHPTVDTYTEAYFKGAKHALSLPTMTFSEAAAILHDLRVWPDSDRKDRAWKHIMHGDANNAMDAMEMAKEATPPSGPDPDEKTPPAASQEPADPDKEDAQ